MLKVYWTKCRAELRLLYFSSWGSEIFSTTKGGLLKFQASNPPIIILNELSLNTSDRPPGTREQKLIIIACTRKARVYLYVFAYICRQSFPWVHHFVETLIQLNIP